MEKTFSCTQCEKTFKELRTLRLHLKIHNSEYPEQCSVCKKVFRTKWQVSRKGYIVALEETHIFCCLPIGSTCPPSPPSRQLAFTERRKIKRKIRGVL